MFIFEIFIFYLYYYYSNESYVNLLYIQCTLKIRFYSPRVIFLTFMYSVETTNVFLCENVPSDSLKLLFCGKSFVPSFNSTKDQKYYVACLSKKRQNSLQWKPTIKYRIFVFIKVQFLSFTRRKSTGVPIQLIWRKLFAP